MTADLLNDMKANENDYDSNEIDIEYTINSNFDLTISKELIDDLLEKLSNFESEDHYLRPGITIQNLAKEYGTNVKYLSKIINYYKGKAFIQYVNDLRIEYAILRLQENKFLRKYTVEALAKEFGFNSKDSFSNAFYKKTGIKPVFFVQELIKQNL